MLPISRCWLQDDTSNALLTNVRELALEKHGLLPSNDPSGQVSRSFGTLFDMLDMFLEQMRVVMKEEVEGEQG